MKKITVFLTVLLLAALPLFSSEADTTDEELAASIEVPEDAGLAVDDDAENQPEPEMPQIKEHAVFSGLVNIRAGYSLISVKGVNEFLSSYRTVREGLGAQVLSEQKMEGAVTAGIDIGFLPFESVPASLGLKISYLNCNSAFSETSLGGNKQKYSFESTAVPLMAGASYELVIPGIPLSLIADAYFGYIFAGGALILEESATTTREEAMFGGGAFTGEAGLKINYKFLDALSGGISIAYSLANAGEMSYSSDAALGALDMKKGDKVVNFHNSDAKMEFDYSGILIGINVNMLY